jgi:plasmid stabilization system protein ParE
MPPNEIRSVELTARAHEDLRRVFVFTMEREVLREAGDPGLAHAAVTSILDSLAGLRRTAFVQRKVPGTPGWREHIIRFGASGFVAQFRIVGDRVEILAIRHQRELGYEA